MFKMLLVGAKAAIFAASGPVYAESLSDDNRRVDWFFFRPRLHCSRVGFGSLWQQ